MTTPITKEWLQQTIAEYEASRDEIPFGLETNSAMELEAFKIALAAMDADPVAWDYEWASYITCEGPQGFKRVIEREAPPQWAIDEGQARNIVPLYTVAPSLTVPDEIIASGSMDIGKQCYSDDMNKYRAAMLQAGNSPAIPDGWQLVPVIAFPSQWAAGQKALISAGINKVDAVYKAMVAAAPQQEVK